MERDQRNFFFKPLNSIPSKVVVVDNVVDNNAITDTYSIANSFNAFFTNIGNNLANNIPATSASPLSFMPASRQSNSFFLNSISVNEIAEEISNLNTSKSSGPFSVPVKIILQKLEYYGIRCMANDWFKSYLDNRKQFVSLGGFKSMLNPTCWVLFVEYHRAQSWSFLVQSFFRKFVLLL